MTIPLVISLTERAAIHYLRVLAILSILVCHILEAYHSNLSGIFYVGVPIFFCISGVLYGKKTIDNKLWIIKRLKRIYIPYFIFIVPALLLFYFFIPYNIKSINYFQHLIGFGFKGFPLGLNHLWFIAAIVTCYVFVPFLQFFRKWRWTLLTISCIILLVDFIFLKGKYYWLPLFMIAYFQSSLNWKKILVTVLLFGIVFVLVYHDVTRYVAIRALSGLAIVQLVIYFFQINNLSNIWNIVKTASTYSYPFYLVHNIIVVGPFSLSHITNSIAFNSIAMILGSIVLSLILCKILKFIHYENLR